MAKTQEVVHVDGHAKPDVADINGQMVFFTWVSFFIVMVIMYKAAWKPILEQIGAREERIDQSLKDAQAIEERMTKIEEQCAATLAKAESQREAIIVEAHKAAKESSALILNKSREEAQRLLTNAENEIRVLTDKARSELREESARLAVDLAGKILEEDIDDRRSKKIVDRFLDKGLI